MTTVIVTTNQKGGCGKTTTCISLASALAMRGYSVTVVDCDPQTNATQAFGVDSEELPSDQFTVVDAYLGKKPADQMEMHFPERLNGNLHLVPGSRGISSVSFRFDAQINSELATQQITQIDADLLKDDQRKRLKASIDSLRGVRDFVFVDTGPSLDLITTTGMIAADRYLIPMIPSGYDLKGLKLLQKAVTQIRERYQPKLQLLGLLLTKVKRTNLDQQIRDLLLQAFDEKDIFKTEIGESVKHREATLYGISIHEHAPGEQASEQYLALADEVLRRLGNPKPIAGTVVAKATGEKPTKSAARPRGQGVGRPAVPAANGKAEPAKAAKTDAKGKAKPKKVAGAR